MKVDSQLVAHVARLAHLKFSDEEAAFYQEQLEKILGYVEQLNDLGIPDAGHPGAGLPAAERSDEIMPGTSPEDAVSQAPEKSGTYFSVPRIIE
jgi:aspartyl-tRNA(Asn)/glutamyl-tRNA(Gln) amidotransferase subunit C